MRARTTTTTTQGFPNRTSPDESFTNRPSVTSAATRSTRRPTTTTTTTRRPTTTTTTTRRPTTTTSTTTLTPTTSTTTLAPTTSTTTLAPTTSTTTTTNSINEYTLSVSSDVSAGIYRASDSEPKTLLRTLFSGKSETSGSHTMYWDGLDDNGNDISDTNDWVCKYESNQITTNWQRILNSSTDISGLGVMNGYSINVYVHPTEDKIYYGQDWNEGGHHILEYVEKTNLHKIIRIGHVEGGNFTPCSTEIICSNTDTVFCAGESPDDGSRFVFAVSKTTDLQVAINGSVDKVRGVTYHTLFYEDGTATNKITGLACNDSFVWCARGGENKIEILNLSTGVITTNSGSQTLQRELVYDNSFGGRVWYYEGVGEIIKADVDPITGQLTTGSVSFNLTGISNKITLGIGLGNTPLGISKYLFIGNGGTDQRIHAFDISTETPSGTSSFTLGTVGGYTTSGSTLITNTRFNLVDNTYGLDKGMKPGRCVQDQYDGKIYVVDTGTRRIVAFDKDRNFLDVVYRAGYQYSATVNMTDATMVFVGGIQLSVNLTTGSWTPVRNFEAQLTANTYQGYTSLFQYVSTFPNGKTYATLSDRSTYPPVMSTQLVELTDTLLNYTGVYANDVGRYFGNTMDKDFTIWQSDTTTIYPATPYGVGDTNIWIWKRLFNYTTGTWGSKTDVLNFPPNEAGSILSNESFVGVNSDGIAIFLNTHTDPNTTFDSPYRIWGYDVTTGVVVFKIFKKDLEQYVGPWNDEFRFEQGNSTNDFTIAFNAVKIVDKYIVLCQHQENWKANQTNEWLIIDGTTGLLVKSFGTTRWEAEEVGLAQPEVAGNCIQMGVAISGNKMVICGGDEGAQGAGQLWINDLINTVEVNSMAIAVNPEVIDGYLQTDEIPWNTVLTNYTHFTRNNAESTGFTIKSGKYTVNENKPDIFMQLTDTIGVRSWEIATHPTINPLVKKWRMTSIFSIGEPFNQLTDYPAIFLQVLDDTDKVIAEITLGKAYNGINKLSINNEILATDVYSRKFLQQLNTLIIESDSLGCYFNYGGYTGYAKYKDLSCNFNQPTKIVGKIDSAKLGDVMTLAVSDIIVKEILTNAPAPTFLVGGGQTLSANEIQLTADMLISGDQTGFYCTVDGIPNTIVGITQVLNKPILQLTNDIAYGQTILVGYSGGTIVNADNVPMADLATELVITNNVAIPNVSIIEVVSQSFRYDGTSNVFSVTLANVKAGDVMAIMTQAYTFANANSINCSAGYTSNLQSDDGNGRRYWRAIANVDALNVTFDFSVGGYIDGTLIVVQSRGLNTGSEISGAVDIKTSTGTNNITSNSFNTTNTNESVLVFTKTTDWDVTWNTKPAGYTDLHTTQFAQWIVSHKWYTTPTSGITVTAGTSGSSADKTQFRIRRKLA